MMQILIFVRMKRVSMNWERILCRPRFGPWIPGIFLLSPCAEKFFVCSPQYGPYKSKGNRLFRTVPGDLVRGFRLSFDFVKCWHMQHTVCSDRSNQSLRAFEWHFAAKWHFCRKSIETFRLRSTFEIWFLLWTLKLIQTKAFYFSAAFFVKLPKKTFQNKKHGFYFSVTEIEPYQIAITFFLQLSSTNGFYY